ncbi:hypothetical protein [Stenotrophomonas sp.]|uniref:hypothetical protein n=1 Tax=Stenotrophomonas sp. TaxID=69392 RepID=UPI0028B03AE8|nr:hypothetical protein [Stenotrophomonas sp.]
MIIKLIVPVLLALCGAGFASSAQAADYFCRVYSGTDTWEKSTVNQGHYKASGATVAQAETAALATGKRNKPNVTLTRARCETSIAAFDSAVPAPAPAPTPAPPPATGAGETYYCLIYKNGNEYVKPTAAHDAGKNIWKIELDTTPMDLEDKAMAFAKSLTNENPTSAICESSIKILLGIDEE